LPQRLQVTKKHKEFTHLREPFCLRAFVAKKTNKMIKVELQPILENELIKAIPLMEENYESLYAVASDPLIWEQHPNKNRYQKEVFEVFFKGAIESGGAFLVRDKKSGEVIGSSRYYFNGSEKKEVCIGYTFLARKCWGKNYNPTLKTMMLDHAFKFTDSVIFHVGSINIRSQKAMEKLGAVKIAEEARAYYGEKESVNFVYKIEKFNWRKDLNSL